MGEPSFVSLSTLLNIRCVVVVGGVWTRRWCCERWLIVRAGGVVTICERLILKKDGGVVLEGVGRASHLIGCIFASF